MPHSRSGLIGRTVRSLARAVLALCLLAAILAGLPYGLLAFGQPPTELSVDLLTQPDDGTLLLALITAVGWVAWACFALAVVIEAVALARHRTAPRVRGLGSLQGLAGFLLGGLVLVMPTAAAAATPTPATAATAPLAPATAAHSPAASAPTDTDTGAPARTATGPVHTVTDTSTTLWDVAEQRLGHGKQWRELAELNPRFSSPEQDLPHGAVLRLPPNASASPVAHTNTDSHGSTSNSPAPQGAPAKAGTGQADEPTFTSHRVQQDETLWGIAEDEYDDPTRWQEIAEVNEGERQPGGETFEDPNTIKPGWTLKIPQQHSDEPDEPQPDGGAPPSGSEHSDQAEPDAPDKTKEKEKANKENAEGSREGASDQPSGKPDRSPAPSPSHRDNASTTPAPSPSGAAAEAEPAAHASPNRAELLSVAGGALALLASAITLALAVRRRLQRRRRRPGETIAIGEEVSPAAAQMGQTAQAQPEMIDDLDTVLRTLAARARGRGEPVPALRAVRLGLRQRTTEVLPADPDAAPAPPFTEGNGGWWRLDEGAELLSREEAREVDAPFPVLVSIGATGPKGEQLLLLNLGHPRVLLLDGDAEAVRQVCVSLALELGMSPWAEHTEIVTVGFGEELPQLLPTARIAHKREVGHVVPDVAEWILTAHQDPEAAVGPYLLLCAAELDGDAAWQLADALDAAGDLPVAVVAPAAHAARHFADAVVLDASDEADQEVDSVGVGVRLQRLEDAAYEQIAAELRTSGQPPHPAQGPWEHVPPEPDPTPRPTGAKSDPSVPVSAAPLSPAGAGPLHNGHEAGVADAVFPALLAASADPAGLSVTATPPLPGPPAEAPSESHGDEDDREGAAPAEPQDETADQAFAGGPADVRAVTAADPHTDDASAPEIRVLGPVEVSGVPATSHGPRVAQVAALLYFRPGRSAEALCADMDPLAPWSTGTLATRVRELRRSWGDDPSGAAYVPRRQAGGDPYRLSPAVHCDWAHFQHLAERGLPQGPAGLEDLEAALDLVRGTPFGPTPPQWAEPHQQEMVVRIVDIAHTVATYRMDSGTAEGLAAARQAIATGLDVDPSAELLYRDWMRVEHHAHNRPGLHTAIKRLQEVNHELTVPLEPETEQLMRDLLSTSP